MFRTLFRTSAVVLCLSLLAASSASAGWFSKSSKYGQNCPAGFCYPNTNASLYPCPRADIPREVGWTLVTNPALVPHEMLYPHTYRALYPPYYYQNKGCLTCLPFFPKPPLKGTEVTVKYKSHFGLLTSFNPPVIPKATSNTSWK